PSSKEEGRERYVSPDQRLPVSVKVHNPSPKKRGMKVVVRVQYARRFHVNDPSPMKRGLKAGTGLINPNRYLGERPIPNEEGTESVADDFGEVVRGEVNDPSPMKRGLKE